MVVVAVVIISKSPPLPARNASDHRLVVVSKNEVVDVIAVGVFVVVLVSSLWKSPLVFVVVLLPSSSSLLKSTPFSARNASVHRLVVVSKNEVGVVLATFLPSSLRTLLPLSSLSKSPPLPCQECI